MNAIIKKLLLAQIRASIDKNFTTRNVMQVFSATISQLNQWASSTQTKLDDWIIDILTLYATDEAFAAAFVQTVKSIVDKSGICSASGDNAVFVEVCTAWCELAPEEEA